MIRHSPTNRAATGRRTGYWCLRLPKTPISSPSSSKGWTRYSETKANRSSVHLHLRVSLLFHRSPIEPWKPLIAFNWYRCDTKLDLEIADHAVMAAKANGVRRYITSAVRWFKLGVKLWPISDPACGTMTTPTTIHKMLTHPSSLWLGLKLQLLYRYPGLRSGDYQNAYGVWGCGRKALWWCEAMQEDGQDPAEVGESRRSRWTLQAWYEDRQNPFFAQNRWGS